jgi:hypothetical protein
MFDKKSFVSFGLALLVAFSALSYSVNFKQNHTSFTSDKDYVTTTKSYLCNEFTTVKSEDLSQSSYSTLKLDRDIFILSHTPCFKIIFSFVNKDAVFHILHTINTDIFKMLFPFHTFW